MVLRVWVVEFKIVGGLDVVEETFCFFFSGFLKKIRCKVAVEREVGRGGVERVGFRRIGLEFSFVRYRYCG